MEKSFETCIANFINSLFLKRKVRIDFYLPPGKMDLNETRLLLINDGQDLPAMKFNKTIQGLYEEDKILPLLCVGIHCGKDRKHEYGTAGILNERGEGAKAKLYTRFILEELIPFISKEYGITSFKEKSFCGFSLGGLSALDIVWSHANEFSKVGVFSGALWWRTLSQDDPEFAEEKHRIMHNKMRNGSHHHGLKFFFEAGTQDETSDRNNNGIIDSIDDTLSLIDELAQKGYNRQTDIYYMEIMNGKHNTATWSLAFPGFLKWGWGK